jgi:hypothetical protein
MRLLGDDRITCIDSQGPLIGATEPVVDDASYYPDCLCSSDGILHAQKWISKYFHAFAEINYQFPHRSSPRKRQPICAHRIADRDGHSDVYLVSHDMLVKCDGVRCVL